MLSTAKQPGHARLDLSLVLDALSDATRRRIVLQLAEKDFCCGSFEALGAKTKLTYHFNRLREAGVISSTKEGRYRILKLQAGALEASFPGLLAAVLRGAKLEARKAR